MWMEGRGKARLFLGTLFVHGVPKPIRLSLFLPSRRFFDLPHPLVFLLSTLRFVELLRIVDLCWIFKLSKSERVLHTV